MKTSEKSNGRILEKWLKFPSSHSDQRNQRLLNFTPIFFCRFKDLGPMLSRPYDNDSLLMCLQMLLYLSMYRQEVASYKMICPIRMLPQ